MVIYIPHRKAHALICFLGQMIPDVHECISKDFANSALENWLESSQSKIKLIEEYPGHLGTISCIYDTLILEKAFCITLKY